MRPAPDQKRVQRYTRSIGDGVARIAALLDMAGGGDAELHDAAAYLAELTSDFELLGLLERDRVRAEPESVDLQPWLTGLVARESRRAARAGIEFTERYRSFLPSRACFDPSLALRAVESLLRVVNARAEPGGIHLGLRYEAPSSRRSTGQLVVEIDARGGGFHDIELGHVFAPFQVNDRIGRPRLGLSVAHGLSVLMGGELCVESPGRSVCSYVLSFDAAPEPGAVWCDPVQNWRRHGRVRPGRVVFVGDGEWLGEGGRRELRRAGYELEYLRRAELLLDHLEMTARRPPVALVVFSPESEPSTVQALSDAAAATGHAVPFALVAGDSHGAHADEVCRLAEPITADDVLRLIVG